MRLSYTPISLLPLFLITFLTLFLKPDAIAQSMLAANYQHYHFENNRTLIEATRDESVQPETISEKYSAETYNRYPSTVNFLRSAVPALSSPNSRRIFTGYLPLRMRIYSTNIEHSMRVTIKLFKVVIVPLWYVRGAGR